MARTATADELVEVLGIGDALRVMEAFPNREVYIAHNPTAETVASLKLGMLISERLATRWGGQKLTIPDCRSVLRARRDEVIYSRWQMGVPYETIAEMFGMCRQRVMQICGRGGCGRRPTPINEKQLELLL